MSIHEKVRAFLSGPENDRLRSWDHCFGYFRRLRSKQISFDRDHAALQLAFYLASWGMYRGSSFLLKYDYTVHRVVVDQLIAPQFDSLWKPEFGENEEDLKLCAAILEAAAAIREAYMPFAKDVGASGVTDTLVTKVLLGTFGCLPAFDTYFYEGWKIIEGYPLPCLRLTFVETTFDFCRRNLTAFKKEQTHIRHERTVPYPLMKLVDMYF